MNEKPEALRLAYALKERHGTNSFEADAADALLRQHAENERLKAANRELGDVVMDYKAGAQALSAKNAILHAELEALRRDAERIDWLERNGIGCDKVGNIGFFVWRNGTRYAGDTPRAAIDAAMEDKTCAALDAAMQEDK